MATNKKHNEMREEAIARIIETLECCYDGYYCDLHNKVFNEDWYRCTSNGAKEVLREYDVFEAIELVQDYEEENFGKVNTELSNPVQLASMVWYIIGDEVIGEMYAIEAFDDNWNNVADEETNEAILEEMKKLFNR